MTLTCDISGRMGTNLLIWGYDGVQVISIAPGATTLPAIRVVSGVEFTVLDTQMYTVSQISFVASIVMSGRTLGCGGNGQTGTVSFHVDPVNVVGEYVGGRGGGGGGLKIILIGLNTCINSELGSYQ